MPGSRIAGAGGGAPSAFDFAFVDGAEVVNNSTRIYANANGSSPASGIAGAHGRVQNATVWGPMPIDVPATQTMRAKGRFRFPAISAGNPFLEFADGGTTQIRLDHGAGGTIKILGHGGLLHETAAVLSVDTHYEIELYAKIANAGDYILILDDTELVSGSGDTQVSGNATAGRVHFNWLGGYVDDVTVRIDTSLTPTGLGQVETLFPDGDGDLSELTPNSGTVHFDRVNTNPFDNTKHVRSTAGNQRDCWTFQNRGIAGTPKAVQMFLIVERHASGTFTGKPFLRIGGVNYDGNLITAPSSADGFFTVWNNNPSTGNAWSDADIDSLQAGVLGVDSDFKVYGAALFVWVST